MFAVAWLSVCSEHDYCNPVSPCLDPQDTCVNLIGSYVCVPPFTPLVVDDAISPAAIGVLGGPMTLTGKRFHSDVQVYVGGPGTGALFSQKIKTNITYRLPDDNPRGIAKTAVTFVAPRMLNFTKNAYVPFWVINPIVNASINAAFDFQTKTNLLYYVRSFPLSTFHSFYFLTVGFV